MGLVDEIVQRTVGLKTPGSGALSLVLGIINLLLWGLGTIIGGVLDNRVADIIIGLLQLFIPFVGWLWAIIWAILMIIRGISG